MKHKKEQEKNKIKFKFEKGEPLKLSEDKKVKVKNFGDKKMEIKYSKNHPKNLSNYIKISKSEYIVKNTGEIREYNSADEFKSDKNKRTSMRKLKDLIYTNFDGKSKNELFITLTDKEENRDIKEFKSYVTYFFKRLKRKYPNRKFEYIYKIELQSNRKMAYSYLVEGC